MVLNSSNEFKVAIPSEIVDAFRHIRLNKGILKPKKSITNEKDIQACSAGQITSGL